MTDIQEIAIRSDADIPFAAYAIADALGLKGSHEDHVAYVKWLEESASKEKEATYASK
jgi:hypothetical protein